MKLQIERRAFHAGLQAVSRAVTGRSSLPILSNVLLEAVGGTLRLVATDLELAIERTLDGVDVASPGSLTLPAKTLSEIVASLPDGKVSIETDENNAGTIACGKSRFRIHGLPAVEFPPPPDVTEATTLDLDADTLRRALQRTLSSVSKDDTRPILTGILVEAGVDAVHFASTDTHRLAVDRFPSPGTGLGDIGAVVPGRAMREVQHLLADADTARCEFGANHARFTVGATVLTTRLLEGTFPKYEKVIPASHSFRLMLDAGELRRAVKRAAVVAREDANRVGFLADGEMLVITANAGSTGTAHEEMAYERDFEEPLSFFLNATYFLEALDAIGGDTITLDGTEPLKPFVLRNPKDESGSLLVLMPMQPQGER